MYTETEGIILRQIKTIRERRMLVVFTKRFGKISAGTSINEKGRNKSALSLRPFTYGKYQINKKGDYFYINRGEVLSSHYRIGEDVDKYVSASYIIEFTDKFLIEETPSPWFFQLLVEVLDMLNRRNAGYTTLVVAYQVKALKYNGSTPQLDACIKCDSKENLTGFHIKDGGVVCSRCKSINKGNERLIYDIEFDIVSVLRYLIESPLISLEKLALNNDTLNELQRLMRFYLAYHLNIGGLKSEEFIYVDK